jgi:hypothetical protein
MHDTIAARQLLADHPQPPDVMGVPGLPWNQPGQHGAAPDGRVDPRVKSPPGDSHDDRETVPPKSTHDRGQWRFDVDQCHDPARWLKEHRWRIT